MPLDALGPPVTDPVRLDLPRPRLAEGVLRGVLVAADRFGNVATSIDRAAFETFACGAPVQVTLAGRSLRLVGTYAEIGDGEVAALFGSAGVPRDRGALGAGARPDGVQASVRRSTWPASLIGCRTP